MKSTLAASQINYPESLYINPNNCNFTVEFVSEKNQRFTFEIFDLTGRKVQSNFLFLSEGDNYVNIDLMGVNQGIYLLRIYSQEFKLIGTKRLSIVK